MGLSSHTNRKGIVETTERFYNPFLFCFYLLFDELLEKYVSLARLTKEEALDEIRSHSSHDRQLRFVFNAFNANC